MLFGFCRVRNPFRGVRFLGIIFGKGFSLVYVTLALFI